MLSIDVPVAAPTVATAAPASARTDQIRNAGMDSVKGRVRYNTYRPHGTLKYATPEEFAQRHRELISKTTPQFQMV